MKVVVLQSSPSVDELIERFGAKHLPFVLDSSLSNDGLGQWSFFGADPFLVFAGKDGAYLERSTLNADEGLRSTGDGLALMRDLMSNYSIVNTIDIPFVGGAVGFLGYDYGRQIEILPNQTIDDREMPDLHFGFYDGIAALNHQTGELSLIALGMRADEDTVLAELQGIVSDPSELKITSQPKRDEWEWNIERADYLQAVERVRSYIASGDVYQVNLSQRAKCRYEGCPIQLYQALRTGNPAPYSALIHTDDFTVLSTSPEQFLRKQGRQIETRPIKGTRPRGATPEEDAEHAEALRISEKDRAELLMIVDLERNDLGRVAEFGSVRVEQLYHQERYARVIHQTAQVKAVLAEGNDVFDCIHAFFPGGSITGAPKVRAMEVIEELEPTRRGVYTGSVGYIGFDGNAEFNIAIRSLHLKDGHLDYQVGGGIVWDSVPECEYQETLDKGRAIRETVDALCLKS
ncbi:MAG: aminodeoxychorismate synthase component I [Opitutae bacterium]|jgi:para-aminobenzoate synthetase component 1|nr:aminodeoxychorismate synthase component I [Opitutae bacterium]